MRYTCYVYSLNGLWKKNVFSSTRLKMNFFPGQWFEQFYSACNAHSELQCPLNVVQVPQIRHLFKTIFNSQTKGERKAIINENTTTVNSNSEMHRKQTVKRRARTKRKAAARSSKMVIWRSKKLNIIVSRLFRDKLTK